MRLHAVLAIALAATACTGGETPLDPDPNTTTIDQGLWGIEGSLEFALDAPWRLDPIVDEGVTTYPSIPIQISFFDEYLWDRDTCEGTACYCQFLPPEELALCQAPKSLGNFCSARVREVLPAGYGGWSTYGWGALAVVERTGKDPTKPSSKAYWPYPGLIGPYQHTCGQLLGQPCTQASGIRSVHDSSEWHARIDHPVSKNPGESVILQIEAKVARGGHDCSEVAHRITFRNHVKVEFGNDPLPRFEDPAWQYADLHYHSQGTDNEGEVGYSYRNVLAAQAAMGIDVVFATDHASNAEQIVDIAVIGDNIWDIAEEFRQGLRDMSPARFDNHRDVLLEGPTGANAASATLWSSSRPTRPRIFLGGEVDIIPVVDEIPTTDWAFSDPDSAWHVPYGNPHYDGDLDHEGVEGLRYDLAGMCDPAPKEYGATARCPYAADPSTMFSEFVDDDGATAYHVRDWQGYDSIDLFSRQHLIYLPRSATQPDNFVSSSTSAYGGATRDLDDGQGVADDITPRGIAFLAHPLSGGGGGRGPGSMPYSEYQLEHAFEHPAIAGLQFWNENNRLRSAPKGSCIPPFGPNGPDLNDPDYQFCIANEWDETGYDYVGVLSDGGYTDGWMAAFFNFIPVWDLRTWTWGIVDHGLDHGLHHGAYTWDRMLRWGIDLGRTSAIDWLPGGEPRKVLMAGGSDAHGDFNYRRTGYMVGPDGTNTTALGSVRNLVFTGATVIEPPAPCTHEHGCPPPLPEDPLSQDVFVDRLQDGRFSITDGPALRIAIDRNRTGIIDDGDLIMGDNLHLDDTELGAVPLLVEWESTDDFGTVDRIDLYIGVDRPTEHGGTTPDLAESRARTYAPTDHGVRRSASELTEDQEGEIAPDMPASAGPPGTEATALMMPDGYWLPAGQDARDMLRIDPDNLTNEANAVGDAWAGTVERTLDLTRYTVAGGARGQRFYIRAFAKTRPLDIRCEMAEDNLQRWFAERQGKCISRYAFTNPIWAVEDQFNVTNCPFEPSSLDRDDDGLPDVCDGNPDVGNAGSWSMHIGGLGADDASAVAHAADGDVFVAGNFQGSPQVEGHGWLQADGVSQDGYVARYAADEPTEALWLQQLRGTGNVTVMDLAVAADGDVVVTGWFGGQLMVDTQNVFTATSDDSFVARLDGDTGQVVWARQMGGNGRQVVESVTIDPDGNVIVGGTYRNEVKFLPTLVRLAGFTNDDCFVAWYGPTGNIWMARPLGGTGACIGRSVAAGAAGIVHFSGQFGGQVVFDPWYDPAGTAVTASSGTDGFVVTFENTGYGWHAHLGGSGSALGTAIAVDPADGDVVVGGSYTGTLVVAAPSGTSTVATSATWDSFVTRIASDGTLDLSGTFTLGGSGSDMLTTLDVDLGWIAVGGVFTSPSWTLGSSTLTLTGTQEGWAALLTPTGAPFWSREIGVAGASMMYTLDLSPTGWLALAGHFSGTVRLDDQRVLTTAGNRDGFWARIDPTP